jgi:hypothetical protein
VVSKEIIEFTNKDSEISKVMEPIVEELISSDPEISYTRVNEEDEPNLRKLIVVSKQAIHHPCFVGLVGGKISGMSSGMTLSKEDLKSLVD